MRIKDDLIGCNNWMVKISQNTWKRCHNFRKRCYDTWKKAITQSKTIYFIDAQKRWHNDRNQRCNTSQYHTKTALNEDWVVIYNICKVHFYHLRQSAAKKSILISFHFETKTSGSKWIYILKDYDKIFPPQKNIFFGGHSNHCLLAILDFFGNFKKLFLKNQCTDWC